MTSYTKLQREANELDLDIYRLVDRLRTFADLTPRGQRLMLQVAAVELSALRGIVRSHMHPQAQRETS